MASIKKYIVSHPYQFSFMMIWSIGYPIIGKYFGWW